ncbi:rimm protein [Lucifera butyrica]|uniref:Ribosome maturation factor RimM n=1 Tax=Lucifera butyrica TaxID=1351585 RepID=A0A498R2F4_9FIRM|nr:ribosome maturation factor RimM [Lucifera butyrica]VBB05644.1 rimm protein [Lucifera butyrica]
MTDNFIAIGKIVAPHGVRGDVRVIPLTDFPERFNGLKTVYLEDGTSLSVQDARFHKQFVLLRFRGLDTMNAVEGLRGKLIQVQRKDAVLLPEGHYYQFEIIGLKVYTVAGDKLGTITDIIRTGSNDVYVVEQADKRPVLVPALKKVVKKIDIKAGQMMVELQKEWE